MILISMIAALAMQAVPAAIVAKPVADPDKKICRNETTTGSIMGTGSAIRARNG